jgi:hypothetical protein
MCTACMFCQASRGTNYHIGIEMRMHRGPAPFPLAYSRSRRSGASENAEAVETRQASVNLGQPRGIAGV